MALVLIIDDEKLICEEFRDILEEENHSVDYALSGSEGLRKIAEKDYDIVFLDILMPRMEGRQVFEEIRRMKQVPVVLISGYLPPNKEKEVLEMGALACLRKPLELAAVKSMIRKVSTS